jgi:hypothetical protein
MGTKMSQEDEKATSGEINYAWRPATRGDIGSIARFRCNRSKVWGYGILNAISQEKPFKYQQENDLGLEWRDVCEIQYNPDETP